MKIQDKPNLPTVVEGWVLMMQAAQSLIPMANPASLEEQGKEKKREKNMSTLQASHWPGSDPHPPSD